MEKIWRASKLFYRPSEVEEILCVHIDTVYELVKLGELLCHARKPGKRGMQIVGTSVENYIHRHLIPPGEWENAVAQQGAKS